MDSKNYQEYVEEIDLQRYWLVLKRRWLPSVLVFAACCMAGGALLASSRETVYQADGKLFLRVERFTALTGIGLGSGVKGTIGLSDPLKNQAAIIRSTPVLEDVVEALGLRDDEGNYRSPEFIKSGLSVRPQGGTDVLVVEHLSPDARFSTAIVNQVMTSYLEYSVALNRSAATAARKFVEEQLPPAKAEMDEAANALLQFQLANQSIDLESEAGNAVERISDLDVRISDLGIQLTEVNTRIAQLTQLLEIPLEEAQQADTLTSAPSVQTLLSELLSIQTTIASQRSRYTEEHPTIASLQRQEAAVSELLNETIEEVLGAEGFTEDREVSLRFLQMSGLGRQLTAQLADAELTRLSLSTQLDSLQQLRTTESNRAATFPTLSKRREELQQRFALARQAYENLQARLRESQLAENQLVGNAEILELAQEPAYPLTASNRRLLFGSLGGGLFLAVATAFFLDLIDKSIKTVKDGEVLLGYTLLGLIPQFGQASEDEVYDATLEHAGQRSPRIIAYDQSQPMAAAAYQMLQANLKFISSDVTRRAITITSSVPQEGKSEVCANLAATMAQAGKKVLLVDADMRSPSQHHLWNVLNQVGLSHVLVGEGKLESALQIVSDNLTLLTAGVIPPNPLALVDSERMGKLVQQLLQEFDYVLFDTPPLIGAADAAMLGKVSDGVLLVMRPRWVDSSSAISTKSLLSRSGTEVLGIVANGVNIRNEHDDYVSQIKAGAYPYAKGVIPERKRRESPLTSLISTSNNDEEDPFKNLQNRQ